MVVIIIYEAFQLLLFGLGCKVVDEFADFLEDYPLFSNLPLAVVVFGTKGIQFLKPFCKEILDLTMVFSLYDQMLFVDLVDAILQG